MSRLGETIRYRRERKGLTQGELARDMGQSVDQTMVSKWETGTIKPRRSTLQRLAESLETPIEVFYEAMEPGQPADQDQVIDPQLARDLVVGSKFAGGTVQRWILNEIENALIRAGGAEEDHPDWIRNLREELRE